MKSHQHKIYWMKDYEQLRKDSFNSKFTKPIRKNNVCLLKQFRFDNNIAKKKPENTAKTAFLSVMLICMWFFAICFLAQATYQFLQAICINSVQELTRDNLN